MVPVANYCIDLETNITQTTAAAAAVAAVAAAATGRQLHCLYFYIIKHLLKLRFLHNFGNKVTTV